MILMLFYCKHLNKKKLNYLIELKYFFYNHGHSALLVYFFKKIPHSNKIQKYQFQLLLKRRQNVQNIS